MAKSVSRTSRTRSSCCASSSHTLAEGRAVQALAGAGRREHIEETIGPEQAIDRVLKTYLKRGLHLSHRRHARMGGLRAAIEIIKGRVLRPFIFADGVVKRDTVNREFRVLISHFRSGTQCALPAYTQSCFSSHIYNRRDT